MAAHLILISLIALLGQFFEAEIATELQVATFHYRQQGVVRLDRDVPAFYAQLYGDDPDNFWGKMNVTVVAQPVPPNVIIWSVKNNDCLRYAGYNNATIPKLAIPETATQLPPAACQDKQCDVYHVPKPYQDVEYCDVFVYGDSIMALEALSYVKGYTVHMRADFRNIIHRHPAREWFNKPDICNT